MVELGGGGRRITAGRWGRFWAGGALLSGEGEGERRRFLLVVDVVWLSVDVGGGVGAAGSLAGSLVGGLGEAGEGKGWVEAGSEPQRSCGRVFEGGGTGRLSLRAETIPKNLVLMWV